MVLKKIVYLFIVIAGGSIGYLYIPDLLTLLGVESNNWLTSPYIGLLIGAIILFLIMFWTVDYIVGFIGWVEETLIKAPVGDLLFGSLGIILGLVTAYLINIPIKDIQIQLVSQVVPIFTTFLLGYLGFQVGFKRREEFSGLLTITKKDREKKKELDSEDVADDTPKVKILDTSVIIDGRIADICQTSFLEGTILIPQFVLEELQHIADSSDVLKRNRGRRGLDVLNRMQKDLPVNVDIYEGDFEEIHEVDRDRKSVV